MPMRSKYIKPKISIVALMQADVVMASIIGNDIINNDDSWENFSA